MKNSIVYKTKGTCSRAIHVTVEDGIVTDVMFDGGCMGNTQGVAKLVCGMKAEDAVARLRGIDCRGRGTSCPDQLSLAILSCMENAINKNKIMEGL